MEGEERIDALNQISSDNENYVILSDGSKIGENVSQDLKKYFNLKLKLEKNKNSSNSKEVSYQQGGDIGPSNSQMVIYNDPNLTLVNSTLKQPPNPPDLTSTEIVKYKNDITKLENIFKKKTYLTFDDIVLLDKFNRFKKKYKILKDDLKQDDNTLIDAIIADLKNKLRITYGINKGDDKEKKIYDGSIEKRVKEKNENIKGGGMIENPNKQIEKEEPSLLDHYKNVKDIYIKLITSYYKLIENEGGEEYEIKMINIDTDDDNYTMINKIKEDEVKAKDAKEVKAKEEEKAKEAISGNRKTLNTDYKMTDYRDTESNNNKKIKNNKYRITFLNEELKIIIGYLLKLYEVCNKIKSIPLMTEYEDHIKDILKTNYISLFEDNDKNKYSQHYIIKDIQTEINNLIKENEKYEEEIKKVEKNIADIQLKQKYNSDNSTQRNRNRNNGGKYYYTVGGEGGDYKTIYSKLHKFLRLEGVGNDDNKGKTADLKDLMYLLKSDSDDIINAVSNKNNITTGVDDTIYENIWNEYIIGINKSGKKNPLKNIDQGDILYDNVNVNNLVPEIALEVTFQDKAIFIFLILIIRTIIMVTVEFIIEYNFVKSLQYTIILYCILYLLLLVLSIGLVNYDSYKLRIIFNYLNLHINSSNIILHLILFVLFVSLIMIMIDSDDLITNFGDLLDYTNVYVHIYENIVSNDKDIFYNTLTRDEKIKMLYRLEIITMIIFIFSAFIILLL